MSRGRLDSAPHSSPSACSLSSWPTSDPLADPKIDRSIEAAAKDLVAPETQQAIDAGLAFLAARQLADGSFGTLASSRRRVAVTALAGMAFLSSGSTPGRGKYGAKVQQAVDFLLSRFQPNGFIYRRGEHRRTFGPMYDHGFATLFLAEVYGMTRNPQVRNSLERAVRLIVNSQNKEGGWRYEPDSKDADLSVTICEMMALRAARNSGESASQSRPSTAAPIRAQVPDARRGISLSVDHDVAAVTFGLTCGRRRGPYSAGVYDGKVESRRGPHTSSAIGPPAAMRPAGQSLLFLQSLLRGPGDVARRRPRFEQWYGEIRDELIHGPFPFHNSGGGWPTRPPTATTTAPRWPSSFCRRPTTTCRFSSDD